jgi:hypothetical protein
VFPSPEFLSQCDDDALGAADIAEHPEVVDNDADVVHPVSRHSIGSTGGVLMIDARAAIVAAADVADSAAEGYAQASGNPRSPPGFAYVQLVPERMQVWKGPVESSGRTVMRAGVWLDDPVD